MPYKDPVKKAEYNKAYREKNKAKAYQKVKEWRAANPEKWKEQQQRYSKKHLDIIAVKSLRWKKANPERTAEISKKSRLKHKARVLANKAKYRATKRNKTPKWVNKDHLMMIKEAYDLAILRTKLFGFVWHVDHVIPLNGTIVSGLHVIENLQVIPGKENLLKNNKYA
jgi:hypothetical protein